MKNSFAGEDQQCHPPVFKGGVDLPKNRNKGRQKIFREKGWDKTFFL